MKTSVLLLSSLLLTLIINLSAADIVFDIDGQQLRPSVSYYVLPVVRGNGGGLKLKNGRSMCPMDVVQEPNEVDRGFPVTFSPVNPKERAISTSSDLNIKFLRSSSICESYVWRLDGKTGSSQLFVSTGGVLGNPGSETINNWFKIEKIQGGNNWYKFLYCPQVCSTCRPSCGDLGIVSKDTSGTRYLALNTGKPFQVFFKKA